MKRLLLLFIVCVPAFACAQGTPQEQPMTVCNPHKTAAGPCATPPKPLYTPSPEYSDEARKLRVVGVVRLAGVLGIDGKLRFIHVSHTLGYGLDEKAIEAAKKWTFAPGTYQGNAVPVPITVEVMFNLNRRSE